MADFERRKCGLSMQAELDRPRHLVSAEPRNFAGQNRSSVPRRHTKRARVPDEYRSENFACRTGTRQANLRVIDGAA